MYVWNILCVDIVIFIRDRIQRYYVYYKQKTFTYTSYIDDHCTIQKLVSLTCSLRRRVQENLTYWYCSLVHVAFFLNNCLVANFSSLVSAYFSLITVFLSTYNFEIHIRNCLRECRRVCHNVSNTFGKGEGLPRISGEFETQYFKILYFSVLL